MGNEDPKVNSITPEAEGDGRNHDGSGVRLWGGHDEEEHRNNVEGNHDPLLSTGTNGSGSRRPDRVADHRSGESAPTNFFDYSLNGMKKMVEAANPDQIDDASRNWKQVFEWLTGGGEGSSGAAQDVEAKDSIAGMLKAAVDNVMEHWEGQAAAAFQRKALELGVSIQNAGQFAKLTADQLDLANKDLKEVRSRVLAMEEPGKVSSFGDWVSDGGEQNDEQAMKDLRNGVRADVVAKANEGELSAKMEKKLEAVALMEQLAANYTTYSRNMKKNTGGWQDDKDGIKEPDKDLDQGGPIGIPGGGAGGPGKGGAAPKPWSAGPPKGIGAAPTVPRDKGITGASQLPSAKTNTDSISPGLSGKTSLPGGGGGGIPGGGGGGGTGGGGLVPGGPGLAGAGGGRSGLGAAGGRSGMAGGAGANRGAGGRAGMGGMGGGMGAGAGAGRGTGAGGRGALAKARGGVVGAAKGMTGKGTGGGGGLHGSRGGTQRGGMTGGMAGGMGGRSGRRGEENERGERPDYLVEDEETWVSEEDRQRNVPKNIE